MGTNVMRRTGGAAAVVLALALGATGCSATADDGAVQVEAGSFQGRGAAQRLGRAAQATIEVTTLQVAATTSISGFSGRGDVSVSTEGAVDLDAGRARLAVDAGDALGGLGRLADLGHLEAIADGGSVYLRSEALSRLADADGKWLKVDADGLTGGRFGEVLGPQQLDPSAFLDLLTDVGAPVTELGTEDVRGVSTTHVEAEVTFAQVLDDLPAERRERLESLLDGLAVGAADLPPVPVEAWVDADGLVRKLSLTVDLGAGKATADRGLGDLVVTETVELFGFGEPVDIQVPDPADVADVDLSRFTD